MNIFLDSGGKILFVSSTLKYHCYLKFKKMSLTVEMGGGLPILMDDPSSGDLEMLVEPGSVVMQSDPSDASQGFSEQNVDWITQVIKYIKKYSHAITKKCNFKSLESVCPRVIIMFCLCPCRHKKHLIQDAELGFAVLHCSTEQHCNPDVPFSEYYVHWSRLFNAFSCPFCGYVVMYFILQMQWVRYRSHRFRPSHSHRQTYWLTTQNQGLGTTIRTLLLHQSFTWICYVMINIVCTCFLFIFRSPVIESRNDPSKIDETTIEPPRNVSKITVLWFRNPKRDFITPHPQMYKQE